MNALYMIPIFRFKKKFEKVWKTSFSLMTFIFNLGSKKYVFQYSCLS
jgi:hypothetical protein